MCHGSKAKTRRFRRGASGALIEMPRVVSPAVFVAPYN